MPRETWSSSDDLHGRRNHKGDRRDAPRGTATPSLSGGHAACRKAGPSASVPPDPEENAGWPPRDGIAGHDGLPQQGGGRFRRLLPHRHVGKSIRTFEIGQRPTAGHGRRIVPGPEMAAAGMLGGRGGLMREAGRAARGEMLVGRAAAAAGCGAGIPAAICRTDLDGGCDHHLREQCRADDKRPTELRAMPIHGPEHPPGDARAAGHRGQTTIANGRRAAVGPAAAGRTVSGRPAAHAGMGMLNTRRSPAPGRRDSPGSGAVRIGRTPSRAGPRGS